MYSVYSTVHYSWAGVDGCRWYKSPIFLTFFRNPVFFLRWMPPGCIRTSTTIYAVSEVKIYQGSIPHPPSSQHRNNHLICLVYLNFLYIVALDLRYDSSPCCLLVWTFMFSECLLSFCILNCWVHLSICFAYSCFPSWSQWLSSSTIILHISSAKWYLRLWRADFSSPTFS